MRRRNAVSLALAAMLGVLAGCNGVSDIVFGSLQLAFGIVEAAS